MVFDTDRSCKILVTFGPALKDENILRELIKCGVNGFRFNFSHGDIDEHEKWLQLIRKISHQENRVVACLADLQGPKIRLGELDSEQIELSADEEIALYPSSHKKPDLKIRAIPVGYDSLLDEVKSGEVVYINDGLVQLEVTGRTDDYLQVRVVTAGTLWSRKGVNLPGSDLKIPAFTPKDQKDLQAIVNSDFDIVAMSFVRRAADIEPVREILKHSDRPLDLIAKIECRQALDNLDEIIGEVEGVIVARGDLGVEISPQRVPYYQKKIIEKANSRGRIVVTATQMLESMIKNPRPTRAETSDVANAVIDGSDVVMLSGETAIGEFPLRAAVTMDEIVRATEQDFKPRPTNLDLDAAGEKNKAAVSMSNAAANCANDLKARAMVVPTFSGSTARLASNVNSQSPVIALCPSSTTLQKTALYRNVHPCVLSMMQDTDSLISGVVDVVCEKGWAKQGDKLVLLAGLPLSQPGVTNFLHVIEI